MGAARPAPGRAGRGRADDVGHEAVAGGESRRPADERCRRAARWRGGGRPRGSERAPFTRKASRPRSRFAAGRRIGDSLPPRGVALGDRRAGRSRRWGRRDLVGVTTRGRPLSSLLIPQRPGQAVDRAHQVAGAKVAKPPAPQIAVAATIGAGRHVQDEVEVAFRRSRLRNRRLRRAGRKPGSDFRPAGDTRQVNRPGASEFPAAGRAGGTLEPRAAQPDRGPGAREPRVAPVSRTRLRGQRRGRVLAPPRRLGPKPTSASRGVLMSTAGCPGRQDPRAEAVELAVFRARRPSRAGPFRDRSRSPRSRMQHAGSITKEHRR